MAGTLIKDSESVAFANAAENGKEYTGSFGNIRITMTFMDDVAFGGRYEILGEDQSAAPFAQAAIDLAKGQDVDDLPDISPKQILAASGESGEEALRYSKFASGALGFVTTRVHRVIYDGFLEDVERMADESDAPFRPEIFRGFGGCAGCASLGLDGSCSSKTGCDS